jgi:hypothetical protein
MPRFRLYAIKLRLGASTIRRANISKLQTGHSDGHRFVPHPYLIRAYAQFRHPRISAHMMTGSSLLNAADTSLSAPRSGQ